MRIKKKSSSPKGIWVVSAAVVLGVLVGGSLVVRAMLTDTDPGKTRKQVVHNVSLLRPPPPPPPKVKEKPPEPEIKKEEVMQEQVPQEARDEQEDQAKDDKPPAGDTLGLDAAGSAGSDGFGLAARKGGRPLIEGSGGSGSGGQDLMRKYAWYTSIIQEELKKRVKQHLDQNGGIPKGKLEAVVRIVVDESGNIVGFTLMGSSGNHGMDEAVKLALSGARVNESPPEGMPRTVKLKVSSQG